MHNYSFLPPVYAEYGGSKSYYISFVFLLAERDIGPVLCVVVG